MLKNVAIITPTHDPRWLEEVYGSLVSQTEAKWTWWIFPRADLSAAQMVVIYGIVARDPVRVTLGPPYMGKAGNVGAHKLHAFSYVVNKQSRFLHDTILVELDHDDLLHPDAVAKVMDVFDVYDEVGFAYSDAVDWSEDGSPVTYHSPERRAAWMADGWRFDRCEVDGNILAYPLSFDPSAQSFSLVMWAPNHLRAWRASTYQAVGGHDPAMPVCDDHDLLIRTYLATRMARAPGPLYRYRVSGTNTWLGRVDEIRRRTEALRDEHLHALVAREMQLRGLPCLDLGGAINPAGGLWRPVDHSLKMGTGWGPDVDLGPGIRPVNYIDMEARAFSVDLSVFPWPFPDSSVGAFRAFDFLEHVADKARVMAEMYRCLAPGGWLLSRTPRADGVGADSDPTHVSRWVERSFLYYVDANLSRFLPEWARARFMIGRLGSVDVDLGDCHAPYVVADLVSLKGDDGRLPGRRRI